MRQEPLAIRHATVCGRPRAAHVSHRIPVPAVMCTQADNCTQVHVHVYVAQTPPAIPCRYAVVKLNQCVLWMQSSEHTAHRAQMLRTYVCMQVAWLLTQACDEDGWLGPRLRLLLLRLRLLLLRL